MIDHANMSRTRATRARNPLLLAAGYGFFAIGFVGMFLPVLPTTIFWIIAAGCFAKSSPAMYRRILTWPGVGEAIGNFIHHGVIRPASKRLAITGMGLGAALLIYADIGPGPTIATLGVIVLAAIYVITRPGGLAPPADDSAIAEQK